MMLSDIRDYIAGLDMAEQCYMGKLDAKKDNSIGCYHLRRSGSSHIPLGGRSNATYDILPVSILIHGSRYAVETVNNQTIKFCRMLVPEPQDVGTDDNGIYEMVIETEFYTEKEEE